MNPAEPRANAHIITAIVLSRHRPDGLERCVASLIAAVLPDHDLSLSIVIAINGRDDRSTSVAAKFLGPANTPPVRLVQLERAELPGQARNLVLAEVLESPTVGSNEWILFLDDDVVVEAGYFDAFAMTAARFPFAAAIGGPNVTPRKATVFERSTGVALSSPFGAYLSFARYVPSGETRLCGEQELILCNLFVRRTFLKAAPFPRHAVCAEENWLLQDLQQAGGPLVYSPELVVRHDRRSRAVDLARQVFKYGSGRGQNLRARPGFWKFANILPSLCLLYVATPPLHARLGLAPYGLYLSLCVLAALLATKQHHERSAVFIRVFLIFPLIHVSYGLGVLRGFLARRRAG